MEVGMKNRADIYTLAKALSIKDNLLGPDILADIAKEEKNW